MSLSAEPELIFRVKLEDSDDTGRGSVLIGLLVVRPRRVDGLSLCRCSSKAPPRFISGSTSIRQYLHFMDTLYDGLSARGNC